MQDLSPDFSRQPGASFIPPTAEQSPFWFSRRAWAFQRRPQARPGLCLARPARFPQFPQRKCKKLHENYQSVYFDLLIVDLSSTNGKISLLY
jgi:hypothetical protein